MITEKKFRGHGWIILLLFVCLLIDGTLTQTLAQFIMTGTFYGVPHLTLMALVMTALLLPEEVYIVPIAIGFGLIFDSYYTGMLGVNTLLWPLIVYVVRQVAPVIPKKPFYLGSVMVIVLTVTAVADYAINQFLGVANGSVIILIANHIGPGLMVNVILFAIAYLPLHRILINLRID